MDEAADWEAAFDKELADETELAGEATMAVLRRRGTSVTSVTSVIRAEFAERRKKYRTVCQSTVM